MHYIVGGISNCLASWSNKKCICAIVINCYRDAKILNYAIFSSTLQTIQDNEHNKYNNQPLSIVWDGIAPAVSWLGIWNLKCWGTWHTHTHTTIFIIVFHNIVQLVKLGWGVDSACHVIEIYRGYISISNEECFETIYIPLSIAFIIW